MDDHVLEQSAAIIEEYTGLRSPPANRSHLRRALEKQARRDGVSAAALASRLHHDPAKRQELFNAVMIGETYFFREAGQFELLHTRLLPEMIRRGGRLSCWSVSCSTGEEAVSIAAVLDDSRRKNGNLSYDVFASDINSDSLERLRAGIFPRSSLRRDGREYHPFILDRHVSDSGERTITIDPNLLKHINVQHLNFFLDDLRVIPGGLDFVFFRNTLLYATAEKRDAILDRVISRLRPGGYLFLATSELPFVSHAALELQNFGGVYVLRRVSQSSPTPVSDTPPRDAEQRSPSGAPRSSREAETDHPAVHSGGDTRDSWESKTSPAPVTSDTVLDLLNSDAPSVVHDETAHPEATVVVARLVVDCYKAVNRDHLDRAATIADDLCAAADHTALAYFCTGWVHYTAGARMEAIAAFDTALEIDPQFWPARFYRTGLTASAPAATVSPAVVRREFQRCIASIDHYESIGESNRFSFLLEGFSPAYFRRMCLRWIERTTNKESI